MYDVSGRTQLDSKKRVLLSNKTSNRSLSHLARDSAGQRRTLDEN